MDESEQATFFRLLSLESLVRMKLTSFRDKNRMHLRDLLEDRTDRRRLACPLPAGVGRAAATDREPRGLTREENFVMKTVENTDATASLASYAEHAEDFPIVITDHGRPIAALMPLPNADAETVSLSSNPEFLSLISRSRSRQTREGGISTQELRRRLEE